MSGSKLIQWNCLQVKLHLMWTITKAKTGADSKSLCSGNQVHSTFRRSLTRLIKSNSRSFKSRLNRLQRMNSNKSASFKDFRSAKLWSTTCNSRKPTNSWSLTWSIWNRLCKIKGGNLRNCKQYCRSCNCRRTRCRRKCLTKTTWNQWWCKQNFRLHWINCSGTKAKRRRVKTASLRFAKTQMICHCRSASL